MNRMCSTIVVLAIAVRALLAGSVADAETYPSRVIRLILPQPAGGAVDLIARSLGENISESLGQPVIVENVPGANGGVAAERVIRSAPDGYTLMVAVDSNLVVNPSLYTNLTYDPFRDLCPLASSPAFTWCLLPIRMFRPTLLPS
jgi:tripartite-type tricarboxylate transporter receptor subunit TctC